MQGESKTRRHLRAACREEGRLAGAIAADKANLFAGGEGDGRAVEYDIDTAAQRDITDGNHKELLRRGQA